MSTPTDKIMPAQTPLPQSRSSAAVLWRRLQSWFGPVVLYALVALLVFAILAPFTWMLISSISPPNELASKPPHWIPQNPTLDRYRALVFGPQPGQSLPIAAEKFFNALISSLVISASTTVVCIIAGAAAAYAFVRLPVPGRQHFLFGMLSAQMLPVIVIIIPLYLVMQTFRLMDTWHGMILLYSGFMLPTVIWIMHSYFQTLPEELEEAAMIDGCSRLGALLRIVIPLSGPGLVAVSAFAFLYTWNEFFMALIFTASKAKTITVIVTEFSTQSGIDYGLMMTGGVIGSLPPLILAFLLQRYIVAGLTAGSLKG
jgi:multiple sugar transport system permease protein